MARFIKIGDYEYINFEQIIAIEFDPYAETPYYRAPCIPLKIVTSDGRAYCFSDRGYDVQKIKQILVDLRYNVGETTEQPPSFWDLTNSIEEWLDERMKENAN